MSEQNIEIAGETIAPGSRRTLRLPVADLYTHTELDMTVQVVHGKKPGPTLFVCAALHGDELNGVEIIRRLLLQRSLRKLHGTLLAVPIVNVHGFLNLSRYLPDRRDLNRSFPGSKTGSLAGRLAHTFASKIVAKADCGIDLHTGAIHRSNLPQIRAHLKNPKTRKLAETFGAPVIIDTGIRDGSLREYADAAGIPMLLYEAGEALRFHEVGIRAGLRGILNVMRALGMLPDAKPPKNLVTPVIANSRAWVRAPASGIVRSPVKLGVRIDSGERLAVISDPFGERETELLAPEGGVIVGRHNLPLVHEGEALFHIASFSSVALAQDTVEEFQTAHQA